MEYSKFTLAMGEVFMKRCDEVYQEEKANPDFLNRDSYENSLERAEAGMDKIAPVVIKSAALAFEKSDELRLGASTQTAQEDLIKSGADPEVLAEAAGYWT